MNIKILRIKFRAFIARYLGGLIYELLKIKFIFFNFNKNKTIIILTPGKVGSSSVYFTLKKALPDYNVFHIHFFSKEGIKKAEEIHLNSDRKSLPLHLMISRLLCEKLNKNSNRNIKIITLMREPISRSISGFFQNIDFYRNELQNKNLEIDNNIAFNKVMNSLSEASSSIEKWIKNEIKDNLKINIYAKKYDAKKGYLIFENDMAKILLMRMEDLDLNFELAIKTFLGIDKEIKINNVNLASNKYYSRNYNELKNKINLSEDVFNGILDSKYFKHFYSDKLETVTNKYLK